MLLVPTDFTAPDANAFRYAVRLAMHYNWKVKLVHVSPLSLITSGDELPIIVSKREENVARLAVFFNAIPFTDAEKRFLDQVCFGMEVVEGLPVDEILAMASAEKAKMIVVGRGPKSAFFRSFLGSVSRSLARSATCPVLLVPPKAKFRELKDLVFAADYASVRPKFLKEVTGLAEEFGSTIQFLHVGEDFNEDDELKDRLEQILLKNGEPRIGWGYSFLQKFGNAELSITDWLFQNRADLVIVSTHQRGFFGKLTHHSFSTGLANALMVPMLVLHEEDRPTPDFKTDKRVRIAG